MSKTPLYVVPYQTLKFKIWKSRKELCEGRIRAGHAEIRGEGHACG